MTKTKKILANLLSLALLFCFLFARPMVPGAFGQTDMMTNLTIAADTTENETLEVFSKKADNKKSIEKESGSRIAYNFIFYALYLYFKTINSYPSR